MAQDTYVHKKIAIIGGGHMGQALALGLVRGKRVKPARLWIADPMLTKIAHLKKYGINTTADNRIAASKADIIFLAVKPSIVREVLGEIKELIGRKLLVSVAAVPRINKLRALTHKSQKIARIMPNLPVQYNKGVIGYYGKNIGKSEEANLLKSLSSLGIVIKVKNEKELDMITLVSACGPAIVSHFMEMLSRYAKKEVSKEMASLVVMQTFYGTLDYLNQSEISPSDFIQSVATKGGIAETILKNLDKGFKKSFIQAMDKGHIKINTLNKLW